MSNIIPFDFGKGIDLRPELLHAIARSGHPDCIKFEVWLCCWLDDIDVFGVRGRPGHGWRPCGTAQRSEVNAMARAAIAAALRRQDIGTSTPLCATELPDGQRLQICLAPAVPHGTISLSIRRPGSEVMPIGDVTKRYDTRDWNKWKRRREARDNSELLALYDASDIDAFFAAAVHARLTILLAGATGAGKTFLSKSLRHCWRSRRVVPGLTYEKPKVDYNSWSISCESSSALREAAVANR